jgi:thiamine biosynthesis lipoprotein
VSATRAIAQHPPTSVPALPVAPRATASWETWSTSVVLRVNAPAALPAARAAVAAELDAIDRACSRFRPDSELSRLNAANADAARAGRPLRVSPLLGEALAVALRTAELTDGAVDPTIGAALVLAGYDRDWRELDSASVPAASAPRPQALPTLRAELRSGWRTVALDAGRARVRVPRGIVLDLGASAKAWAADRAARRAHEQCGCGVLLSIGGDIATAGPAPQGGWHVHVTDDHRSGPDAPGQTVRIACGGLATSSTLTRRWRRGATVAHHIIDPASGAPALGRWRTVSVAAGDCLDANAASTAALVRGDAGAAAWLERRGLPARLVAHDGLVLTVGEWPAAAVEPGRGSGEGPRAHPRGAAA